MEVEEIFVRPEPIEETAMLYDEIEHNIKLEVVETISSIDTATILYVCDICLKKVASKSDLEHHLTIVHRPLTVNIINGAYCTSCRMIFDENIYDSHICASKSKKSKRITAQIFNFSPTNKQQLECNICNAITTNAKKLLEHLRTVHRPITTNFENKSEYSFCDKCRKLFKDDFFCHFPCDAVDVKCFFCLTKMPLKQHFMFHNLQWNEFRKFQCNICKKCTRLMSFTELNEHMKEHNNGLGLFQCVKCKLHMKQTDLQKHYDLCHRGCKCVAEPCTCEVYDEYFYIRSILKVFVPNVNLKPTVNVTNNSVRSPTIAPTNKNPLKPSESSPVLLTSNTEDQHLHKIEFDKSISNTKIVHLLKESETRYLEKELNKNVQQLKTSKRKKHSLSKFQLKKKKREVILRNQKIRRIYKNANNDEQKNSVLLKEQDALTSDIMDSVIIKEEENFSDSENVTQELYKLLEDIPDDVSKDAKENLEKQTELPEKYLTVQNENHKKLKMQNDDNLTTTYGNEPQVLEDSLNEKNEDSPENAYLNQSSGSLSPYNFPRNKKSSQTCGLCSLNFSTADCLNDHLEEVHKLKETYIKQTIFCPHCKMFKQKTHFPCEKNPGVEICQFCNMSFPKIEHFKLHNIKFHSYSEMFCMECDNKVHYKVNTLNEHRIKEHNDVGVYECLFCGAKFSTNTKMKEHLVYSNHKFDFDNSAEKYNLQKNYTNDLKYTKCEQCDRIFFEERFIKAHRCQQFKCNECSKTFVQQTSLIYHMAIHTKENVFICSVCDVVFDKQSQLTTHMAVHNEDGTNPHKCDVCNRLFTHKCKLLVHKISHRKNKD